MISKVNKQYYNKIEKNGFQISLRKFVNNNNNYNDISDNYLCLDISFYLLLFLLSHLLKLKDIRMVLLWHSTIIKSNLKIIQILLYILFHIAMMM